LQLKNHTQETTEERVINQPFLDEHLCSAHFSIGLYETRTIIQIGYRSECKIHFYVVVVVQWLIFHGSVAVVHVGLLILEVSRSYSSQRVIGPSQIPLPDNIQHRQVTDIHALGGIRTSKRVAANPRLKPRGHRDRQWLIYYYIKLRCLSPHANYTDRAADAGRRS